MELDQPPIFSQEGVSLPNSRVKNTLQISTKLLRAKNNWLKLAPHVHANDGATSLFGVSM